MQQLKERGQDEKALLKGRLNEIGEYWISVSGKAINGAQHFQQQHRRHL
jgi:hypothetical protein